MTGFRLTQISDTHLARRFSQLTTNFERLSDHIDTTRPDLVINSGDVAFERRTNPDESRIRAHAARRAAGAVPLSAGQSRHRR